MKTDLRKSHRYAFDRIFPASYKTRSGEARTMLVRGRDISETGVCVLSSEPLENSASLFLRSDEDKLSGNAVVRHCRKVETGFLIGLEFSGFSIKVARAADADDTDLYEALQVSRNADTETIHRVYRILAARYHPDNNDTGDPERFLRVTKAYETLSNPAARQAYDLQPRAEAGARPSFTPSEFIEDVWGESRRRLAILCLLYNRRRSDIDKPYLGLLDFERLLSCDRESLGFSIWYLKEKRYVTTDGGSEYCITAAGVEKVESEAPAARAVCKLLECTTAAYAA